MRRRPLAWTCGRGRRREQRCTPAQLEHLGQLLTRRLRLVGRLHNRRRRRWRMDGGERRGGCQRMRRSLSRRRESRVRHMRRHRRGRSDLTARASSRAGRHRAMPQRRDLRFRTKRGQPQLGRNRNHLVVRRHQKSTTHDPRNRHDRDAGQKRATTLGSWRGCRRRHRARTSPQRRIGHPLTETWLRLSRQPRAQRWRVLNCRLPCDMRVHG